MIKVCHLSSAHTRYDIRIYMKECCSLAGAGFAVTYIVADGKGDESKNNVSILDVGVSTGRINRMLAVTRRVLLKARSVDADIYHLHDPELIPIGLILRRSGKKVIFDAHEDFPKQLLTKPYLNKHLAKCMSHFFSIFERWAFRKFNALVAATPSIQTSLAGLNKYVVDINNYPLPGELSSDTINWELKGNVVCYIGAISSIRGILPLVDAMSLAKSDTTLEIAGKFSEVDIKKQVMRHRAWDKCIDHGLVDRGEVKSILERAFAGIVTFLPVPNHTDSQPNKMFEYMSAGIPVIASNFPLWRDIIDGNNCGVCVDPLDAQAIADAIDMLATNLPLAERMGKNGQRAVVESYNWKVEEVKLVSLYSKLVE